jgi:hypothetical protein
LVVALLAYRCPTTPSCVTLAANSGHFMSYDAANWLADKSLCAASWVASALYSRYFYPHSLIYNNFVQKRLDPTLSAGNLMGGDHDAALQTGICRQHCWTN